MKISAKTDYACIAMLELSKQYGKDGPVSISTISERHGISETFLVHIMKDLKKSGLVESIRGAHGGYQLTKRPEQVSVAQVIHAIEGPMIDIKCMHPPGQDGCELEPTCELQSVWDVIKLRIVSVLDELTFDEVRRLANLFEGQTNGSEEQLQAIKEEALRNS